MSTRRGLLALIGLAPAILPSALQSQAVDALATLGGHATPPLGIGFAGDRASGGLAVWKNPLVLAARAAADAADKRSYRHQRNLRRLHSMSDAARYAYGEATAEASRKHWQALTDIVQKLEG